MYCGKCGNKIQDGEKFCGKCGAKVEIIDEKTESNVEGTNNKKTKKNKKIFIISIIIIVIISSIVAIIINNANDNFIFKAVSFGKVISKEELENILKNNDNGTGIYLQGSTIKIGPAINVKYKNYNKLVSYSCTYINGSVTLNSGGVVLYNKKEKASKIISMSTDLSSIIYYFNSNNEEEKLRDIIEEIMNYIAENGEEAHIGIDNTKAYMQLGTKIGEIAGVNLCRNIIKEDLKKLGILIDDAIFLYKANEIFDRYMGIYITEQEYCWTGISESVAQMLFNYNKSAYNNLVAINGPAYKTVKKFAIYDMTKEESPLLGKYDSLEKAKATLKIEE